MNRASVSWSSSIEAGKSHSDMVYLYGCQVGATCSLATVLLCFVLDWFVRFDFFDGTGIEHRVSLLL